MIDFNSRNLTPTENQCVISGENNVWQYTTLQNPTLTQLNEMGQNGWHINGIVYDQPNQKIWYIFEKGGALKMVCGIDNYSVVGQAIQPTQTTEFLIHKSWTYGEIAQTAMLFIIAAFGIFALLFSIIKRRSYV
jgi:hypothetical protein